MRGRLPETKPRAVLPDWGFDPVVWRQHHATDIPDEPTDEESIVQEHIFEIKDNIQKSLSEPLAKIAPYCLTPNEYLSLLDIARVIQQDMQTLQDGLSRCGRPPDQRDGDYIPAPIWDAAYLTEIINAWNEPVALEPDYYLLRSMCLYELGVSIQVSVLGQEKVQRYMNMALTLAQRGERILKTKLGPGDGAVKFWRYQTMMSYIYQYQAKMAITAIKRRRELTGLLDQAAVDQACDLASRALRCFHRGMRYHPNVMSTGTGTEEPFKDEEWIKMTDLAESCFHLVDDIATCRTWCRHTLKLLLGALYENRAQAGRFLGLIAKTQLEYAVWIHEQKETPLVVVPKPCPLFLEMRHASIAALIYASQAIVATGEEATRPAQYRRVIDALHMMTLTCMAPNLIHLYAREASSWIDQLKARFPDEPINPSYLYSAEFMAAKDRAIQAITQHRQAHSSV